MKSSVGIWIKLVSKMLFALSAVAVYSCAIYLIVIKEYSLEICLLVATGMTLCFGLLYMMLYAYGEIVDSLQQIKRSVVNLSESAEKMETVLRDAEFLCEQSIRMGELMEFYLNGQSNIENTNFE